MFADSSIRKILILTLSLAMALTAGPALRFSQPTQTDQDRRTVISCWIPGVGNRLEEASLAWYQLSQRYGLPEKTEANLHPYTATLESLPANLTGTDLSPKGWLPNQSN